MSEAQPINIPVDQLTDEEIAALEAQGADLSERIVSVQPSQASVSAPGDAPAAEDDAPKEKKLVPAPKPSADVVERVKQRVENQKILEGSSFEHRDSDGRVVEKEGEVQGQEVEEEPEEEPIDAQDRANFLAHILGGERFKKSFPLFGGRLIVTFVTRRVDEDETCAKQSYLDENLEGGFGGNTAAVRDAQRMQRYFDYQFIASLQSLAISNQPPRSFRPWETPIPVDCQNKLGWTALRSARIELYKEISQPLRMALRAMHNKFETLVNRLAAAAEQPDFWEAGSDI